MASCVDAVIELAWLVPDCSVFVDCVDCEPFAGTPLSEVEVVPVALVDGVVACDDDVLPLVLRLPEADALPVPLKLPEAEVEFEPELGDCVDVEDDEGVVCDDDEMPGEKVAVLEDDPELLLAEGVDVLELGDVWVEVCAWTQSAAANRNGVPTAMSFNGRFMMMTSHFTIAAGPPARLRFYPRPASLRRQAESDASSRSDDLARDFRRTSRGRFRFPS